MHHKATSSCAVTHKHMQCELLSCACCFSLAISFCRLSHEIMGSSTPLIKEAFHWGVSHHIMLYAPCTPIWSVCVCVFVCVCVCMHMGRTLQIQKVRHSLQTGWLHSMKKSHTMGHKPARGCIQLEAKGDHGGGVEAKVHLESPHPWGSPRRAALRTPTGDPTSTGQNKRSGVPSPSQVLTFDTFQRHWLLFFSVKTNYHQFNPPTPLPPDVTSDVTPFPFAIAPLFLNLPLEREAVEERNEEEVEEAGGVY